MNKDEIWRVRDRIKEVCEFSPMDREVVKEKVSELDDVSKDLVEEVIQDLLSEGEFFKPDAKSIQRT